MRRIADIRHRDCSRTGGRANDCNCFVLVDKTVAGKRAVNSVVGLHVVGYQFNLFSHNAAIFIDFIKIVLEEKLWGNADVSIVAGQVADITDDNGVIGGTTAGTQNGQYEHCDKQQADKFFDLHVWTSS